MKKQKDLLVQLYDSWIVGFCARYFGVKRNKSR